MRRNSFALLASSLVALACSGTQAAVNTFDDLALLSNSFYAPGHTGSGNVDYVFTSGSASFKNQFTDFGFGDCGSTGWTYSNQTDTKTTGFTNQYSAYAGGG